MARLLKNAGWLRGGNQQHHRLETDDYFSDSDADSDYEDQRPMQGSPVRQVLQAKTALPQDITFVVPNSDEIETLQGVEIVCIQGPHGPIRVPLPLGAKCGEQCSVRLGPPAQYHVTVPEGFKEGESVKFEGTNGEQLTAAVPPGRKPGDIFEVSLPVLLVQVPAGAKAGMEVMYEAPDRQARFARVPKGIAPGHYFPVLIAPPGHDFPVAETTWPLELSFVTPENPGDSVCLQGPHGPIMVPLPPDAKPGQQTKIQIGPQGDEGAYEVGVPDGAAPGDAVKFKGVSGEDFHANVPEGKKPGDKFRVMLPTVMVRVPPGSRPGTEVMFQTPGDQQVRFTKIPDGLSAGHYFPVLLQAPTPAPKVEEKEKQEKAEDVQEAKKEDVVEDAILIETQVDSISGETITE